MPEIFLHDAEKPRRVHYGDPHQIREIISLGIEVYHPVTAPKSDFPIHPFSNPIKPT
jgi:hypothetical protein